jgi:ribosome-associated translation inhibitor RaiA
MGSQSKPHMKIVLKHIHHSPSASFTALIEQHLKELGKSLQIDEARVVIERRLEASPPFGISAHLVTPGPDVFAEAEDHTLRAALLKMIDQIERRIDHRLLKRTTRSRQSKNPSPGRFATSGARN